MSTAATRFLHICMDQAAAQDGIPLLTACMHRTVVAIDGQRHAQLFPRLHTPSGRGRHADRPTIIASIKVVGHSRPVLSALLGDAVKLPSGLGVIRCVGPTRSFQLRTPQYTCSHCTTDAGTGIVDPSVIRLCGGGEVQILPPDTILVCALLAAVVMREAITPSDLVRWTLSGRLPLLMLPHVCRPALEHAPPGFLLPLLQPSGKCPLFAL